MRALCLLACSIPLAGCFDQHGRHDDHDAGSPTDSGRYFTECYDALWGGEQGDACRFDESCSDIAPCTDEPTREVVCLGGRLMFYTRTCTLAPWESCESYIDRGGYPGDACFTDGFGECVVPTDEPCCDRVVTCASGLVSDEVVCRRGCIEGPYCEGYAPPPPELVPCVSTSQCGASESCVPPGVPRACGICAPIPHECGDSSDCGAGQVCVYENVPCSCEPELGSFCRPACTEGSCAEGERCGADGACAPIRCTDGYECPANTRCDGAGDEHGCQRIACSSDPDCDCGVCIDGACYDGPGTCQPPVP